jgi:hypothetical protein
MALSCIRVTVRATATHRPSSVCVQKGTRSYSRPLQNHSNCRSHSSFMGQDMSPSQFCPWCELPVAILVARKAVPVLTEMPAHSS